MVQSTTITKNRIAKPIMLTPQDVIRIKEMMTFLYPNNLCAIYYTNDRYVGFDMFEVHRTIETHSPSDVYHWLELCNFIIGPKIYEILGIKSGDSYIGINQHAIDDHLINHLYDLFLAAKHC